jgi:hypothetical protein
LHLGSLDETRHNFGEALSRTWGQQRKAWLEIVVYKVALPAELLFSKHHDHKQPMLPLEMANRFIPYVPKPMNEKCSSKPLRKNVPKEFSTLNDTQQTERNSVPIRVPTADSDLPIHAVEHSNE